MITALTQFGDSSSGIGALGIDGKAFVIQLITFLLAFWVLKRYAFGPIIKIMNQRRETIERGVTLTEQLEQAKTALEAKVEAELHKARQDADGIIAGAKDAAQTTIAEAEGKARDKAAAIVKEADTRIAQDASRARQALEHELVNLVSDATEAIIDEKVDAQKDVALIERTLKERQAA